MINSSSIIDSLSQHQPILLEDTPHAAAVMVILLNNENQDYDIVLTKRAATLLTYAGDYSLPGGMRDPGEVDLSVTVTREVEEELSLAATTYQRIGQLDDFQDRDGNLVRPFVASMKKSDFEKLHRRSTAEIADIYFFPLQQLSAIKDDPGFHPITHRQPSYTYTDGEVFVWGLTAAILVHIFNILTGANKSLGKKIIP